MERTLSNSKVTSKGQMTLPKTVRDHLGVVPGDNLVFIVRDDAVTIMKADTFLDRIDKLSKAMEGEAEKAGLFTEEDVVNLIHEIRHK